MRTHQLTVSPAYRPEDPPSPKQQRCTGEKDSVLAGEMQLAEAPRSCRSRATWATGSPEAGWAPWQRCPQGKGDEHSVWMLLDSATLDQGGGEQRWMPAALMKSDHFSPGFTRPTA